MDKKDLTRRQARVLAIILDLSFQVIFRVGTSNSKADALTRMPGSAPVSHSDKRSKHQR